MQQLSDSLLKELQNNPYTRCAKNLSILCKENILVITGHVSSFYQKQMIQEVLRKIVHLDMRHLNLCLKNEVQVRYTDSERDSED